MKKIPYLLLAFLGGLTVVFSTHAQETNHVKTENLVQQLKQVFGERDIRIEDYDDRLKSVIIDSAHFYYTTYDGRYVFSGPVLDTLRKVDIVAEKEAGFRKSVLASLPKNMFVSYPSADLSEHEITVFTDIDCPYCRKLHLTIPEMNRRGISVNYIMVPRAGENSASYSKTLSALCADQPAVSITQAMRNRDPEPLRCDTTRLKQQMALARKLNITSTPTVVLPSGGLHVGLVSPDKLAGLLGKAQ